MRLCGEKGTDDGGEGEHVAEEFCFVLRDARCTSFEAVGSAGAGVLMNSININDINTKLSLQRYHFPVGSIATKEASQLLIYFGREERRNR
jgi:hypothetical protein